MYRTGDRGARRQDGEIEFRGRLDRQTKIRGQRVELDEIGSVLNRHAGIDFATAIVNVSEAGENQLVAYVLPKGNARVPTALELKQHLLRRLPDYMVPTTIVRLRSLPISPNGKVDLTMLPAPTEAELLEAVRAKAPASAIEEELLAIVQELLENDSVSVEDGFFLAGGHSLLGTQLVMRLHYAFGVDLTLRQLLEAPTIRRLALLVETILSEKSLAEIWKELLGLEQVGLDDRFFDQGGCSDLLPDLQQRIAEKFDKYIPIAQFFTNATIRQQAGLTLRHPREKPALPPGVQAIQSFGSRSNIFWIHYLGVDMAKGFGKDQPFFFVSLVAEDFLRLGVAPTMQSIAACLLGKILATQTSGPYTIGGLCLGGILAYEVACQLRASGHEVSLVVLLDAPNPSYLHLQSCDTLTRKASYLKYVLKRAVRIGVRTSLDHVREELPRIFAPVARERSAKTEIDRAQELAETAALKYQPREYDGKVLLLLASERPPHVNFLPGWQAVVTGKLHVQYLNAHHRDLQKAENVSIVAKAIAPHLILPGDSNPLSRDVDKSEKTQA